MANTKHGSYGTIVSALGTELNALATNTNTSVSSAIDNRTNLDLFADIELVLGAQGSARAVYALINLYITPSADDTNYADANEQAAEILAVFPLDATVTARRVVVRDCPIPPGLFKVFARNQTGQALAATGNTIKLRPHSIVTA